MADIFTEPGYIVLITISLVVASFVVWFMSKSMIRAAEFPDPQPLVIALALLTLVALIGALFSKNENAYTLAATGIGAIAGAVTATWANKKDTDKEE